MRFTTADNIEGRFDRPTRECIEQDRNQQLAGLQALRRKFAQLNRGENNKTFAFRPPSAPVCAA